MFSPGNLSARRGLLLLLLAAAAAICAAIFFRSWNSARAPRPGASLRPALSRPIERAAEEALRQAQTRPNPAMQKAGLPDPRSQKTAAASAVKAAQAAAELAASAAPGN
jgi:DNA-directed RNA polymerase specialized sigma24 family protein